MPRSHTQFGTSLISGRRALTSVQDDTGVNGMVGIQVLVAGVMQC